MGFGLTKQRISPIAVDFGGDSLKLLQVVPDEPAQLAAVAARVVPDEARLNAQTRLTFYTQALPKLLKQQPFKGRRAMLAIPAPSTLMQNVEVAIGEGNDISTQLQAHLRDRLEIDPQRMIIRHVEVGQIARDGANFNEVVCLAAPRDVVIRYLNLARQCKLDVVGMHSTPQTILRAFDQAHAPTTHPQSAIAYLDMGAASTSMVIAHGRRLVFAKQISIAGDQITRQYAQDHDMNFSEARATRLQHTPKSNADNSADVLVADCQNIVGNLIDEIQLCMRYYQRRFAHKPIEKLVFLGGESRHTDLCQKIAQTLRITAQLGDPFSTLTQTSRMTQPAGIDLNQPQPGWAVPYGLCWSEANL